MAQSYSRGSIRLTGLVPEQRKRVIENLDHAEWRYTREVSDRLPWSVHTINDRLRDLRNEDLVESRKVGRQTQWRLL